MRNNSNFKLDGRLSRLDMQQGKLVILFYKYMQKYASYIVVVCNEKVK